MVSISPTLFEDTEIKIIAKWQRRLVDISWFMRSLNEFIARKENKEDNCKGRFKSQALLDEQALLTCMAYVDLNPIRARMFGSVESSECTSTFKRIHGTSSHDEKVCSDIISKTLFGFLTGESSDQGQGIPYALLDYLDLFDWN